VSLKDKIQKKKQRAAHDLFDDINDNANNMNVNNNDKENVNINNNVNVKNHKENTDLVSFSQNLDRMLGEKQNYLQNKKQVGFWLDKDVVDALDIVTKGAGRGVRSKIVNDLLRSVFQEKGLL
jgi:uncharacterized protein (DUF4415 family)